MRAVMSSHAPGLPAAQGEPWCAAVAAAVFVLCTLPWLNPFSAGPVPSVLPWLFSALAVAIAVLVSVAQKWSSANAPGEIWAAVLAAAVLALAAWPRIATLPDYEFLALAGALLMVGLGAVLSRHLLPAPPVGVAPPGRRWMLLSWIAAGSISSTLALLQYFGHAAPLAPWVNWAPPGEAFANLRQRNQFASLTSIAIAALWAGWLLPKRRVRSLAATLLLAAALALLAVANAASASRTGLLQILSLAAIALVWRRDRRVLAWLCWMLGCYALATFALPWAAGLDPSQHGMFSRLRDGDALCSSRLTLWSNVLQLIAQRPWLGWGWGELDYAHYITLYDGPRFCDILDNAHNLPLHLAVELGVPAAVLVCGAVVIGVVRARPWRETDPIRRAAWMVLAVIGAHSLLEYPLWYGPFQLALGLALGMLWRDAGVSAAGGRTVLTLPALLAASMLGAVAYAAWDYRRISQIYLPVPLRQAEYRDDTLAKLQRSALFQRQVRFAELSVGELGADNAAHVHALATELLHFSPEPRVIERLLDSARLLGLDAEVAFHTARYKAAFPQPYAQWAAAQAAR